MLLYDSARLAAYLEADVVERLLAELTRPADAVFASQRWLAETPPKRLIFWDLYGDLLEGPAASRSVADIGGGYTALTRRLVQRNDYTLVDIMAHDPHASLEATAAELGRAFWLNADWSEVAPDQVYDVVVANDLFPNVDQRVELFLERWLPACRELRLSLTYYNTPRYYKVKRVDGEEIFNIVAWSGRNLEPVLRRYEDRIVEPDFDILEAHESVFPNGRQVCGVRLRGGVAG